MEKLMRKIGIQFFAESEEEDDDSEDDNDEEFEDEEDSEDVAEDNEDDVEEETEETDEEDNVEETKSNENVSNKNEKPKQKQSKAKNNFFKNQRLAEKEIQKAKEKAKIEGMLEAINHTNPYTKEKIVDDADIEEYLTMREMEQKGLSPVDDYKDYIKTKRREAIQQAKNSQTQEEFIAKDANEFLKKYPSVNFNELMKNEDFMDFAENQLGKVPLVDIYESFNKFTSKYEKRVDTAVEEKVKKQKARLQSSPKGIGNSKSSTSNKNIDIDNMSESEFDALIARAKRGGFKL